MSPSVNVQKVNILAALVSLLQCRRRKDAAISPSSQKRVASQGARKKRQSANLGDSDDTQKSTDMSGSTRDPSSDGSDLDSPTSNDAKRVAARSPPGLSISPPPGLSKHKAFAPPVSRYPKNQLSESVDENPLSALKEAITKLSHQDAAVVRSFLLAKEGEQKTPPMLDRNVMDSLALRNEDCQRARVYSNRPMEGSWRNAVGARREPVEARSRKPTARQQAAIDMAKNVDTLRTSLRDLAALDSERVVMVRKIHRLGFDSEPALEAYFSQFGSIDRLMVNHTCCKSTSGSARARPAKVGFVVMSTVEEANAIKALGEEQVVQGSIVCVADFQSHPIDE